MAGPPGPMGPAGPPGPPGPAFRITVSCLIFEVQNLQSFYSQDYHKGHAVTGCCASWRPRT